MSGNDANASEDWGTPVGVIVGSTVAVAGVIVVIVGFCFLVFRRRRRNSQGPDASPPPATDSTPQLRTSDSESEGSHGDIHDYHVEEPSLPPPVAQAHPERARSVSQLSMGSTGKRYAAPLLTLRCHTHPFAGPRHGHDHGLAPLPKRGGLPPLASRLHRQPEGLRGAREELPGPAPLGFAGDDEDSRWETYRKSSRNILRNDS